MSIYIFLIVPLVFSIILKSLTFKGYIGEISVSYQLNNLDKDKYLILHDITIQSGGVLIELRGKYGKGLWELSEV
ncbi:hypothetical protein QFZ81_001018 [Paenibacillus sp. V4I9]|nr:hypothetical protein [Paenibacillus sp. V4I9]